MVSKFKYNKLSFFNKSCDISGSHYVLFDRTGSKNGSSGCEGCRHLSQTYTKYYITVNWTTNTSQKHLISQIELNNDKPVRGCKSLETGAELNL